MPSSEQHISVVIQYIIIYDHTNCYEPHESQLGPIRRLCSEKLDVGRVVLNTGARVGSRPMFLFLDATTSL